MDGLPVMHKKIECLIFDCDGTLVDSEYLCNLGLVKKLAEVEIEADANELMHRFRGWKLANIMDSLEEIYDIELESAFEPTYRQIVSDLFETELQPIEGVRKVLGQIDLPMCVASSGPRQKIEQALRVTELSHFFGRNLFSSYEIGSWKPEPDLFLHAADQMGFPPEQCAVIEDSEVGIAAAVAAGMRPIHFKPDGALSDVGPILTLSRMIDLPRLLS